MPEGAARGHKKRSCTQSHSWTPFIHQFMMDHPSYAIILQIHTFNLPKIHEKQPFILPGFPHLKVPVKSATCFECTIQNRGVRCACTYAWAHNNKYLWRTSNFFSVTLSEILSYFSNRINWLKVINFKKVGLTFIKNNHTYFWKWYQISTNIDYWQGHERYLCMGTCGILTNRRHGNHILMYERTFRGLIKPIGEMPYDIW